LSFSVSQAENTNKTVWTILEVDGNMYCSAGFHMVNRFGYIITENLGKQVKKNLCMRTIQKMMMLYLILFLSLIIQIRVLDIVNGQLGLPDYDSVFNNLGIVNDGFSNLFTNNSSVNVLHENIRIRFSNVTKNSYWMMHKQLIQWMK
jgi:uncharacterized membrane protein